MARMTIFVFVWCIGLPVGQLFYAPVAQKSGKSGQKVAVRSAAPSQSEGVPLSGLGTPSMDTKPTVTLQLLDPNETLFVWRATRIQFSIVNGIKPSGIKIKALTLSIPSVMALKGMNQKPGGELQLITETLEMRTPGERRDFAPVELIPISMGEMGNRFLSILMYRPQKQRLVATLSYESLRDSVPDQVSVTLDQEVQAHPFGMYFGALVGSLLASLLILTYRSSKQPKPPLSDLRAEFRARFFRGAVATAIAVFVFQTSSDIHFPVSISVHDFYGGCLLGLFGDKVAEEIMKRI